MINYAGSSDPAALNKASSVTYVDAHTSPLLVMATDEDAMPPEQYDDLVKKLNASGAHDFRSCCARTAALTPSPTGRKCVSSALLS